MSTDKLTIVTGDCNLPDIDWSHYSGPNTAIYDALLNFVNNNGFHQYVQEAMRYNNILDIVMATSEWVSEWASNKDKKKNVKSRLLS